MSSLFTLELTKDIADAFVGFMSDMYTPSSAGKLPILTAMTKNHRYLYLSLLGIIMLIAIQILTGGGFLLSINQR